jgi:hypothetical protein
MHLAWESAAALDCGAPGPASVEFEGQRPPIAGRGSSAHLSGACHETRIMTEQSGIGV